MRLPTRVERVARHAGKADSLRDAKVTEAEGRKSLRKGGGGGGRGVVLGKLLGRGDRDF